MMAIISLIGICNCMKGGFTNIVVFGFDFGTGIVANVNIGGTVIVTFAI